LGLEIGKHLKIPPLSSNNAIIAPVAYCHSLHIPRSWPVFLGVDYDDDDDSDDDYE
jgi:hypothetical protein